MKTPQRIEGSQERFLNTVIRENVPVIVYLVNGVQLRGNVRGFDTYTLYLEPPGRPVGPVYKSAVTSIVPMRPIRLYNSPDQPLHEGSNERTA